MLLGVASAVVATVIVVAPIGGEGSGGVDLPAVAAAGAPTGVQTRAAPGALSLQCLQEPACRVAAVGDADGVLRADVQAPAPPSTEPTVRLTLHRRDGVVVGEERVSGKPELLGAALAPVVAHLLQTAATLTSAPPAASSTTSTAAGDVPADAGVPWPLLVGGVCAGGCGLCIASSLGLAFLASADDNRSSGSGGGGCDGPDCNVDLGFGDACSDAFSGIGDGCSGIGDGIGSVGDACSGIGDIGCAAPAVSGPLARGATPTSPTFLVPPPAEDDPRQGEMPW